MVVVVIKSVGLFVVGEVEMIFVLVGEGGVFKMEE